MMENGILIIIVGLTIFIGIIYNIRIKRATNPAGFAPDFLIAFYLIALGLVWIFFMSSPYFDKIVHESALVLLFLPAAYAIADNSGNTGRDGKSTGLWALSAVVLLSLHISFNYGASDIGHENFILEGAVTIFFGLGMMRFAGFQKFVLLMVILFWSALHFAPSIGLASHFIAIMGSIVFFKANFTSISNIFDNFDFQAEDIFNANVHPFLILNLSGRIVYANREFLALSGYSDKDLEGKDAIELFEIPNNWIMKINPQEGYKRIKCHLQTRAGRKLPILLWLNEIRKYGKDLKNLVCFIYDESERQSMENKINAEGRRFAGLHETSKALSSSLEMKDVLEAITSAAEALTDSDTCTLFSLDHGRQVIRPLYSTEQVYSDEVMNFEFPVGQGLTGRVIGDGKPRMQNYDDDTDVAVHIPGTSDEEESILAAPLLAKNVVIGALTLYKIGKKRFDTEDLETLTVFASQAASALETSRLYMKVKDSEKVYRSSVDLAGDGIMFVDPETGKVIDANEMAKKMLDYTRSQIVAKYVWELHPQPQMNMARQLWQSVKSNGKDMITEIEYESRSGKIIPASINASIIATGDIKFIQWVVRDMSELKMTIDRMGFCRSILRNLGEPVLITDAGGGVCFANQAFKKLFPADFNLGDKTQGENINIRTLRIAVLDEIWEQLQKNSGYAGEVVFGSGRDKRIAKIVHVLPNYDGGAKLTHFFWIFHPSAAKDEKSVAISHASLI